MAVDLAAAWREICRDRNAQDAGVGRDRDGGPHCHVNIRLVGAVPGRRRNRVRDGLGHVEGEWQQARPAVIVADGGNEVAPILACTDLAVKRAGQRLLRGVQRTAASWICHRRNQARGIGQRRVTSLSGQVERDDLKINALPGWQIDVMQIGQYTHVGRNAGSVLDHVEVQVGDGGAAIRQTGHCDP